MTYCPNGCGSKLTTDVPHLCPLVISKPGTIIREPYPSEALVSYPDDNPKTQFGVKKTPLHLVPTAGIEAEAWAFQCGADKYGAYNWREKTISSSVYYAATLRHLQAWWNGEELDAESGHPHLGHARACLNMIMDGALHGKLNDNRPPRATKEMK